MLACHIWAMLIVLCSFRASKGVYTTFELPYLPVCSDVIDVTVVEPHSMETAEVRGRTRDYQ